MSDSLIHLLIVLGLGTGALPGRPAPPREVGPAAAIETVACRSGSATATPGPRALCGAAAHKAAAGAPPLPVGMAARSR